MNRLPSLPGSFDPNLPLEQARTIPAAWYTDPAVAAAERLHVFGNSWQAIGPAEPVSRPGSFVTADVAEEPVLVLRDNEGVLRAFANVCRHRAARVVQREAGQLTKLRCPYHGWTYDLTGRLRGTPEFEGVADFCREDNGLVPLNVAAWGKQVFIHLGQQRSSLESFLSPLSERTAGLELEKLKFVERRRYDLACNWKVFVDNYLDGGYHVNAVHPGLAGVLDYSEYRTEVFANTSLQSSPMKPADRDAVSQQVGQVRSGDRAYYWWVFPNLMLNIYQGVMDTNLVLPLGVDRCRVIFDFYFTETETLEAKKFIANSIAVGHQIQMEDVGICEDVQRGLASRFFDSGRFSVRREVAGYHFHRLLAQWLCATT